MKCPKCGMDLAEGGILVTSRRTRVYGREPGGTDLMRLGDAGGEEIDGMQCRCCYTVLKGECLETLRVGIA